MGLSAAPGDLAALAARRDRFPWTPSNLSPWFWSVVARAERDRSKLRALLDAMTREEVIAFHVEFQDAAVALTEPQYVEHMDPDTSEDGADDVSRWVVAQGEAFYRDVYDHPERVPGADPPHSPAHLFYEIGGAFQRRFKEDLLRVEDELGLL